MDSKEAEDKIHGSFWIDLFEFAKNGLETDAKDSVAKKLVLLLLKINTKGYSKEFSFEKILGAFCNENDRLKLFSKNEKDATNKFTFAILMDCTKCSEYGLGKEFTPYIGTDTANSIEFVQNQIEAVSNLLLGNNNENNIALNIGIHEFSAKNYNKAVSSVQSEEWIIRAKNCLKNGNFFGSNHCCFDISDDYNDFQVLQARLFNIMACANMNNTDDSATMFTLAKIEFLTHIKVVQSLTGIKDLLKYKHICCNAKLNDYYIESYHSDKSKEIYLLIKDLNNNGIANTLIDTIIDNSKSLLARRISVLNNINNTRVASRSQFQYYFGVQNWLRSVSSGIEPAYSVKITELEFGNYEYKIFSNVQIIIPDEARSRANGSLRLSGKIWLPESSTNVKNNNAKFAALLELSPYRHSDATLQRDSTNYEYLASNGIACIRVDIRGSGNSSGYLYDEYLISEQIDAINIMQWIKKQDWCNGNIFLFGKSWSGLNSLEIATMPMSYIKDETLLSGVIALHFSNNIYKRDIHCMGGCLLTSNLGMC